MNDNWCDGDCLADICSLLCECVCCFCCESDSPRQASSNYAAVPVPVPIPMPIQNQEFVQLQPVKLIAFLRGHIGEEIVPLNPEIVQYSKIIDIFDAEFDGEFYDSVLKYCKMMKYLSVRYNCETFSDVALKECMKTGTENLWQQRILPSLEHLCWDAYKLPPHLDRLFQQNPNISSFCTGSHIFSETLDLFLHTNIKIDELCLELRNIPDSKAWEEDINKINSIHNRLQFRSLMMSLPSLSALENPRLAHLTYLNGVCCEVSDNDVIKINEMPNVKLLIIKNKKTLITPSMAETLSKQLNNLGELYLCINSLDQIAPFICNSPKLRKIFVYSLDEISKSVEIASLNNERKKLENACKIEVYLPDFETNKSTFSFTHMWDDMGSSLIVIKSSTPTVLERPFVVNALRSYIVSKMQS